MGSQELSKKFFQVPNSVPGTAFARRSLCQQKATRLPLFIKCGLPMDHGETNYAGKFFLRDHIR